MKTITFLFLITLIFIFPNCVSFTKEAPKKRFFTIEADTTKISKNSKSKFEKLKINKLRITSNYEGKEFTYRKDFDFESDFYNQFLVSPSTNITEQLVNWINESKISGVVTNRVASSDSNLILEGNINLLYADFSGGKIHSVIEIEFYLSDNSKDQVLFKKVYTKKNLLADKEPVSILKGWNKALTEILIDLETDLKVITL